MEGYDYISSSKGNSRDVKPVIKEQNENSGITLRCIWEIYNQVDAINAKGYKKIAISCSFLQIYNEKVFDLLNIAN